MAHAQASWYTNEPHKREIGWLAFASHSRGRNKHIKQLRFRCGWDARNMNKLRAMLVDSVSLSSSLFAPMCYCRTNWEMAPDQRYRLLSVHIVLKRWPYKMYKNCETALLNLSHIAIVKLRLDTILQIQVTMLFWLRNMSLRCFTISYSICAFQLYRLLTTMHYYHHLFLTFDVLSFAMT